MGDDLMGNPEIDAVGCPPQWVCVGCVGVCSVDRKLVFVLKTRRAVFAILAVLSTVAALALAYAAFGSESGLTPTIALVGIFVLLVFPAMTVWAWAWDRSVRKKTAGRVVGRRRAPLLVEHAGGRQPRGSRPEPKSVEPEPEPKPKFHKNR